MALTTILPHYATKAPCIGMGGMQENFPGRPAGRPGPATSSSPPAL